MTTGAVEEGPFEVYSWVRVGDNPDPGQIISERCEDGEWFYDINMPWARFHDVSETDLEAVSLREAVASEGEKP